MPRVTFMCSQIWSSSLSDSTTCCMTISILPSSFAQTQSHIHKTFVSAFHTSPKNTFHNQGQKSSFSSKQVCFPKYPVPIASPLALKGGKTGLVWINTFSLSLSLFFFRIDFFLQPSGKIRRPEVRADWSIITLFHVNYFILLGFLVGYLT